MKLLAKERSCRPSTSRTGTVNYRVAGPEDSDAPPVVFVHGLLVDHAVDRRRRRGSPTTASARTRPTCRSARTRSRSNADADLRPRGVARLIIDFLDALGPDRRHARRQRHRRRALPVPDRHRPLAHRPARADQLRRVRQVPAGAVRADRQGRPEPDAAARHDGVDASSACCGTRCWASAGSSTSRSIPS